MPLLAALVFASTLLAADNAEVGSQACAACHANIYRSYRATGMARSSGRVGDGGFDEKLPARSIRDTPQGPVYRLAKGNGSYRMQFEHGMLKGERDLRWFIGSGNVGRSYLFSTDGFLFQAPVSYYTSAERWDLSPGYAGKPKVELAKPAEEPCLYCHTSQFHPIPSTQNRYQDPPFEESGVGCERCHGPGRLHVVNMQSAQPGAALEIVNPAKLDPARRNSICEQCHLTGAARVVRSGSSISSYRPGGLLSDHLSVLVWEGRSETGAATDHAEQLGRSQCQIASGARLWCGTCHDPHSQPSPATRIAYYQKPCLSCHSEKPCTQSPASRALLKDDCAACHMPKTQSREGEHVVFTGHQIRRRPSQLQTAASERKLKLFWPLPAPARDLALAYASFALSDPSYRPVALNLLEQAERSCPEDAPLLAQLAQFADAMGRAKQAEASYERVLRLDPANAAAAANLAIYRMRSGRQAEAIALWKDTFSRNPGLSGPGINLAVAQLGAGDSAAAEATLQRLLLFHPDLDSAKQLLVKARSAKTPVRDPRD